MRKRSDIDISVWRTHLLAKGRPTYGRGDYHLQTRHNYEISYPYEWGERLDEAPRLAVFFGFVPVQRYH
jgi:hypothetical protein